MRAGTFSFLASVAALAIAFAPAARPARAVDDGAAGSAPVVALDSGRVTGRAADRGVRAYLGIPFAAPPVGPLRWKPPQPVATWEGVRACESYGAPCPQPSSPLAVTGDQSEDCLFLNVWSGAAKGAKQPVMVWIHGGAFFLGSGSGPVYDGAALAQKGVVVVTVNYRLGPFGFLGHPLLSKESEHGSSGNYGLLDQIAALQWVQRNAAAFGGDPGNVTIFGESAGAYSVGFLLVSPLAKGLFHGAISQSGAAIWSLRRLREPGGLEEPVEATGERVLRELVGDADDVLAAARVKNASELLAASRPTLRLFGDEPGNVFAPAADGWVIPEPPRRLFAEGRFNVVPLLIGTNGDEGTMFVPGPVSPAVDGPFRAALRERYGPLGKGLADHYDPKNFADARSARAEFVADVVFVAPSRAQARATTGSGAKCFVYSFTRVAGRGPIAESMGAYHGSEIPYVFGHVDTGVLARYVATDRSLSDTVMEYWVQFARTGDPNREGLPPWPAYSEKADEHLDLGDEIAIGTGLHEEACDLWDEVMAAVGR